MKKTPKLVVAAAAVALSFGTSCSDTEQVKLPAPILLEQEPASTEEDQVDVALRDFAASLFAEDRFEDCLAALEPLISRENPIAWDLCAAAIAADNCDDPLRAETLFKRAIELDPTSPVPHFNLGKLSMIDWDLDAALVYFEKAYALAPDDLPTRLDLSRVLHELERFEEAEAHLIGLMEVGLDYSGSWYNTILYRYSRFQFEEGRDDEAIELMNQRDVLIARGFTAPTETDIRRGNFGRVLPPNPISQQTLPARSIGTFGEARPLGFDAELNFVGLVATGLKEYWKRPRNPEDAEPIGTADWIAWGPDGVFSLVKGKQGMITKAAADRVLALDVDDDGDVDLITFDGASLRLLIKQPVKFEAKDLVSLPSAPLDARLVDYDHEGDLDLLVVGDFGVRLFRNDGSEKVEGKFTDVTEDAGLGGQRALDWCITEDFDTDQDVDLVFGGAVGVLLADNLRGGKFAWQNQRLGNLPIGTKPLVADIDSDGRPDFTFGKAGSFLVRPDGTYRKFAAEDKSPGAGGQPLALIGDLDGNGNADGIGTGPGGELLWYPGLASSAKLAIAQFDAWGGLVDVNGDRTSDLVVIRAGKPLVHERSGHSAKQIRIFLQGVKDNRRAVGAILEVRAGNIYRRHYWTDSDQAVGIGAQTEAEVIRVTWPNGVVQNMLNQPAGEDIVMLQKEGLVGSCPFLYSWNGTEFTFVSDVLGITPLGLPMAPGMLVPPDHDEFVLVTGEQLQPREIDGGSFYDLQFTEELREVTYLDKARLIVVDHPIGSEVFPDERFTFPPFPGGHTHITEAPAGPTSAHEVDMSTGLASGRDWAKEMAAIDGEYAAPFEHYHGRFQGLAKPHMVELAFDPALVQNAQQLRLFMTGWFFWTNASVNMAAARTPGVDFVPPIFSVPDGQGGWRDLGPPFGFPAGKTKTMVVDLTGVLDPADPRIRVFSTLRLYWDAVRLGTDGDDAVMAETELAPVSAELWERGFSKPISLMGDHELEWFDWNELEGEPRWNQHPGRYTKFGEVLPLLDEAEDRFVIMGSGDALRLRFDASQAPPLAPGMRRDFLLYLDGWAKDRDPNSIQVEYVEPMPFHAMSGFPYGPDEAFPSTPEHQAWRAEWNTRDAKTWIRPLSTKR